MYSNSQLGLIKPSKCHEEAINWFKFGFKVIPVVSGSKRTALTWDPWLADLSINTINDYWIRNLNAELGAITGDDVIVFDADSPESITALLKVWIQDNVSDWYYEPIEPEECQERMAA